MIYVCPPYFTAPTYEDLFKAASTFGISHDFMRYKSGASYFKVSERRTNIFALVDFKIVGRAELFQRAKLIVAKTEEARREADAISQKPTMTYSSKGYLTEYPCGGNTFALYVIAGDIESANAIISERGLGETIVSSRSQIDPLIRYSLLPHDVFVEKLSEATHMACFLGYICGDARPLLADNGLIHELVHLLDGSVPITTDSVASVKGAFLELEQRCRGLFPDTQCVPTTIPPR